MKCILCKETISEMLDRAAGDETLAAVFRHLSDCADCRKFYADTHAVHEATRRFQHAKAPAELDQKLGVLGMESGYPHKKISVTFSVPSALFSVGAVLMMVLFIYAVGSIQERNLSANFQRTMEQMHQRPSTH